MRVLHLVEPSAGGDALAACRAAALTTGIEHRTWLIGGSDAERRAAMAGIVTTDRVPAAMGIAELASRGVRAMARDRDGWRPDVAQCWSVGALAVARRVFARTPRVGCLPHGPEATRPDWLRARRLRSALGGGWGAATVLALDEQTGAAWRTAGAADVRIAPPPLPRGTNPGAGAVIRRGFMDHLGPPARGQTDGEWTLIALLGDPPAAVDARGFAFVLGLLYTAGRTVAGVVSRGAGNARRASRFVRAHGRRWGLVEHDGPMVEAAAACDLALWDGGGGLVQAAACCAAGAPVVARDSAAARSLLAPVARECLVDRPGVAAMSARLLPLTEDLSARRAVGARIKDRIADLARGESFEGVLTGIWSEAARESARSAGARSWANAGGHAALVGAAT